MTIQYPFVSKQVSHVARSQFRLNLKDCNACGVCEEVCPVRAVEIQYLDSMGDLELINQKKVRQIYVDFGQCVSCGICVEECEPRALIYERKDFPVDVVRSGLVTGLVKNKSLPEVAKRT